MSCLKFSFAFLSAAALAMFAQNASATLGLQPLVNAGFESPVVAPNNDIPGAQGWTTFNNVFTANNAISGVSQGAYAGDQSLKLFGGGANGVYQDFPALPGEVWNAGAWILNPSSDPLANGQVAAVNLEWLVAAGGPNFDFISNGTTTAASPQDVWTQQTVTGVAPAGTAFARITLITGDFLPGGPGGAPFYDDAFIENLGVIPEPGTIALAGMGLLAIVGGRRRS